MKECETCNKEIPTGRSVWVLWKWPENYKAVHLCDHCAQIAYDEFLEFLKIRKGLEGLKK